MQILQVFSSMAGSTIKALLEKILSYSVRYEQIFKWFANPVVIFVGAVTTVLTQFHQLLYRFLTEIDNAVASAEVSIGQHQLNTVASDFWTTINTFIPLDTIFTLAAVLLAMRAAFAIVRIIKSFVPTIAS